MLFFRGAEPENVSFEGLMPMLDLLFEKSLGNFPSKAESLKSGLKGSVSEFVEACDELEKLEAEPDMEDMYITNYSSIVRSKVHYTNALKNVINSLQLEAKGENTYEKYRLLLDNLNNTIDSIQKVNASFKTVMYSYSNYLRKFKKSFSSIEHIAKQLGVELELVRRHYEAYRSIASEIKSLGLEIDKIEETKAELETLQASVNARDLNKLKDDEAKLAEELSSKRSEISKVESEIASLSAKIQSLVAPLHRVSKKFDHLSARKQQLHAFIENPVASISADSEYLEFMQLLKDLNEYLQKGKLEIGGEKDISEAVNLLLHYNLYADIKKMSQLDNMRKQMLEEAASMSRVIDEVAKGKMSHQQSLSEIERLRKAEEQDKSSLASRKAKIEEMVFEHYRKRIKIAL
ncbi:MAG: hypothetical protein ACP5RF_00405 [Candidatus Micrarchaeia archaeon]